MKSYNVKIIEKKTKKNKSYNSKKPNHDMNSGGQTVDLRSNSMTHYGKTYKRLSNIFRALRAISSQAMTHLSMSASIGFRWNLTFDDLYYLVTSFLTWAKTIAKILSIFSQAFECRWPLLDALLSFSDRGVVIRPRRREVGPDPRRGTG